MEDLRGAAVQDRGLWPGVSLCRQGLGYDHDRMAAALRSFSAGRLWLPGRPDWGHPRRLCVPMPRAGRLPQRTGNKDGGPAALCGASLATQGALPESLYALSGLPVLTEVLIAIKEP